MAGARGGVNGRGRTRGRGGGEDSGYGLPSFGDRISTTSTNLVPPSRDRTSIGVVSLNVAIGLPPISDSTSRRKSPASSSARSASRRTEYSLIARAVANGLSDNKTRLSVIKKKPLHLDSHVNFLVVCYICRYNTQTCKLPILVRGSAILVLVPILELTSVLFLIAIFPKYNRIH